MTAKVNFASVDEEYSAPPPQTDEYIENEDDEIMPQDDDFLPQTQTQPQDDTPLYITESFPHLWGRLCPTTPGKPTIEFLRERNQYSIGRRLADFSLDSPKISSVHCWFRYDELEDAVYIQDVSRNGTYVNNKLLGKDNTERLLPSSEIYFGNPSESTIIDYRYFFRTSDEATPAIGGGLEEKYQMLDVLGKGAFGTVRKVFHRQERKNYACKIFVMSKLTDANYDKHIQTFIKEIEILQRLDHPNIVHFKEHFQDDASLYIVMELVDGGDLLDYIQKRQGGFIPETDCQAMTRTLCRSIAYSHSAGVTHRDLKPENILMTKPVLGALPDPKIADFGLAKVTDSQTFLRTMCGTPAYLAPEVVAGFPHGYSEVVDSWSLGVIVYAMLTGHNCIKEPDEPTIEKRILNRNIEWHHLLSYGISPAATDWLHKMIEENPIKRMTMEQALTHPWLANGWSLTNGSFAMAGANDLRQPGNVIPLNGVSSSESFSTATVHAARRTATPSTPVDDFQPKALEQCSQEFGNLYIDSSGAIVPAMGDSFVGGIMQEFPPVPRSDDIVIPYPTGPASSLLTGRESSSIKLGALGSAWSPGVVVQNTIKPVSNKRPIDAVLSSSPPPPPRNVEIRSPSPSSSELSSLSDEAETSPQSSSRPKIQPRAPRTLLAGTRVSARLTAVANAASTAVKGAKRRRIAATTRKAGPRASAPEGNGTPNASRRPKVKAPDHSIMSTPPPVNGHDVETGGTSEPVTPTRRRLAAIATGMKTRKSTRR